MNAERWQQLKIGVVVVLVLGAGFWAYRYWYSGGPEGAIHQRLDNLAALLSKEAGESTLEGLGKARRVVSFLGSEVSLDLHPSYPASRDRDALVGLVASFRNRVRDGSVSLQQRQITVAENGRRATVVLVARADFSTAGGTDRHRGRYRMEWVLEDGEWVIVSASLLSD